MGQENLSSYGLDLKHKDAPMGRQQHQQMTVDEVWKMSLNHPDVGRSPFSKARFLDDGQQLYMTGNATENDRRLNL